MRRPVVAIDAIHAATLALGALLPAVVLGQFVAKVAGAAAWGWLIDLTGNWNVPFATGVVILLIGAAVVGVLRPDVPLKVPADG